MGNMAVSPAYPQFGQARILWQLIGANMNVTTDQAFTKVGTFNEWLTIGQPISTVYRSGASLTIAAGGIYTAAAKGGLAFLSASTVFSTMTAIGNIQLNGSNNNRPANASTLFFSLTTPQGTAATADIYIIGIPLN